MPRGRRTHQIDFVPVAPTDGWRERGDCWNTDPAAFFPDPSDTEGIRAARAVCAMCDVRAECLGDALARGASDDLYGIRGTLLPAERNRLRRAGERPERIDTPRTRGSVVANGTCRLCDRPLSDHGTTEWCARGWKAG